MSAERRALARRIAARLFALPFLAVMAVFVLCAALLGPLVRLVVAALPEDDR